MYEYKMELTMQTNKKQNIVETTVKLISRDKEYQMISPTAMYFMLDQMGTARITRITKKEV